ncbi:MAG: protein TolQ [Desulfobacterales bacterium]|nr:protein TolQ [Desulfobacterales bacterium]
MNYELDLIHMISSAGLMVQLVLLLLIAFSISSWSIIFIKYRYISRAFKESAIFAELFWKSKDLSSAFSKSKPLEISPVAKIFRVGYTELKRISQSRVPAQSSEGEVTLASMSSKYMGLDNVKRSLARASNAETTRMTQLIPFLATTGNTTPFIGLFGTVWGIMNSFHSIGQKGSASLAVVAPGISEALVTTAAGLAVAIPAVIAFNYFMQKIRVIESELSNFSADFLNIIEREILREEKGD